jgi:hypothetical protein
MVCFKVLARNSTLEAEKNLNKVNRDMRFLQQCFFLKGPRTTALRLFVQPQ